MNAFAEKHIVAIDLGTSKMSLTVTKVCGNDIQIVYYKETPSAGIKYSGVVNILHAYAPLTHLIQEAEEDLSIKINQAVIGMPKFPIRQESNSGMVPDRGEDTEITAEDIANLKKFAQETYPLEDPKKEAIYGAVAQSFSDGEYFQIIENDIIGMTSDVLEGHFKIFIGKKKDLKNADNLLSRAGITSKKKYFTAETTAKAVLTDIEMENGVALVDFGGGSTSVTIYHGNIMRHYASIPFGGRSITNDIKSELQISERLAENIKLAFGACMPDRLQSLSEKVLHITGNPAEQAKEVTLKYLSEIITARVEEIIQAILYEINESGLAEHLRGGIVVTGGCAEMANLGILIKQMSGYNVRTGYPLNTWSSQGIEGISATSAATAIGLVQAALEEESMNCAVYEERFHTELEAVEIAPAPAAVETVEKEVVVETTVAEETVEEVQPVIVPEVTVPEVKAPAAAPEVPAEVKEEEDEDYDPELEDDDDENAFGKNGIGHKFMIFWGKAKRKIEKVGDRTDAMIDNISE